MKILFAAALAALAMAPLGARAASTHFKAGAPPQGGGAPAFSSAVLVGDTLYIAGTTDGKDPSLGGPPADAKVAAAMVLDGIKKAVEAAGMNMDDIVWIQIFASDLKYYGDFNQVYRTYFKGPLPARAFIGAGALLGNAHYEVTGIAVRGAASKE